MRVLLQHSVAGTGLSKTRELSPTAVLPSVLACFDPRLSRGFLSRRLSHTRVFLQERTRRVISFHDTFFRPNKRGRKLSSRLSLSLSLSLSLVPLLFDSLKRIDVCGGCKRRRLQVCNCCGRGFSFSERMPRAMFACFIAWVFSRSYAV